MQPRSLSHLLDHVLTNELKSLVARDRTTTAELLAHLAEFDARKLHLPAGFSSLYDYCVHELGMSEDMACKRSVAARLSRRYPGILPAIADGRLHLSGVVMLAPYLRKAPAQARELLSASVRRTRAEIATLIATRFPSEDVPTSLRPLLHRGVEARTAASAEAPPATVAMTPPPLQPDSIPEPCSAGSSAPGRMEFLENSAFLTHRELPPAPRPTIAPLSAERYELRGTISRQFHEKLVRIRELLSHAVPSGDAWNCSSAARTRSSSKPSAKGRPVRRSRIRARRPWPPTQRIAACRWSCVASSGSATAASARS